MGLFAGYAVNGFRGGFEYDSKTIGELSEQINSAYGTYKLNDKWSILGRFDQHDEDTSVDNDVIRAIIAGIHFKVEKGLTISPTLRMTTLEGGDTENAIVVNFQFKF